MAYSVWSIIWHYALSDYGLYAPEKGVKGSLLEPHYLIQAFEVFMHIEERALDSQRFNAY